MVLTWGNHDAAAGIDDHFPSINNVYRPTYDGITIPGLPLTFHGCDVQERRDNRLVMPSFPAVTEPGHIGVLHTSVTGEYSNHACLPSTIPELQATGYDAWILGHVHEPISLSEQPPIFWPGIGKLRVLEV